MSKVAHIGVAAVFAALAAWSVISVAGAAPQTASVAKASCENGFCFVAIF